MQGKVAIITGATSGIGERTSEVFIQQGAAVVMAARSRAKGEALAERLGERAIFVRTDVAREADLQALAQAAVARFGRIDCLFNNAGAGERVPPIDQIEEAQIRSALGLLFNSVLLAIKHTVPHMKRGGGGSIINNASVAAHRVGHGSILYSAAKAAVVAATRWRRWSWARATSGSTASRRARSQPRSSGAAALMPRPPSAVWRPWPRSWNAASP